MVNKADKQRQAVLRSIYRTGWDILETWARCACEEGVCPLQAELDRWDVEPGDLLLALVTGDPRHIGVAS